MMMIVNFEYQKEKARKIKKRVERLQEWVKSLDSYLIEYQEYKGDKKHKEEVVIPIFLRDFNNELDDLAEILHNMKISNVPEPKSDNV
jgi:hypothetical protein